MGFERTLCHFMRCRMTSLSQLPVSQILHAPDENVFFASNLESGEFYGQTEKYSTQLVGEVKVACTRVLAISDRWGEFTQPIYYLLAKLRSFNVDF